ncbi:MAG: tyrosine-type recombinase/integrase [Nocardioidaceae bacterium]|nr:tyrosine-type recombinase/integrase [Nocardioidaceae bacterium]
MASIVKRETTQGVRYDVRYRDPAGKVRTKTFRRSEDARKFSNTTEADKVRGTWLDPNKGRLTFAEWWDLWWPTTVNLRPTSRARDESIARTHLEPEFGDYPLAAIDHTMVTAWVAKLTASGLAPATVQKAQQVLAKCLDAAVDSGRIGNNPCDRVKLPRIERREMEFLTPAQVATLADCIDERYRALVLVGAYCGLRFGEMAGLKPARVDLLHRRIEVAEILTEVKGHHHIGPPKTRAGHRSVPVPTFVAAALEAHLAEHTVGDYLFTSPEGGPLRASLFRRRVWQPACVKAGVGEYLSDEKALRDRKYRGLRIHDLRHTAVALWIAAGASPKEVADRAGHSSVVTVLDRYGHLLPGHEEGVNDALDAMAADAVAVSSAPVRAMDAR